MSFLKSILTPIWQHITIILLLIIIAAIEVLFVELGHRATYIVTPLLFIASSYIGHHEVMRANHEGDGGFTDFLGGIIAFTIAILCLVAILAVSLSY